MIKINQQITFLPTNCLEEVEYFYQKVLSLKKVLDQGDCVIFKVADSAYIGFCRRTVIQKPDHVILTLVTKQVDLFYRILKNNGIKCEGEPKQNDTYRIYHFFVQDPNGYRIEVQEFLDGFDGR